jgi:hypothetical protein
MWRILIIKNPDKDDLFHRSYLDGDNAKVNKKYATKLGTKKA